MRIVSYTSKYILRNLNLLTLTLISRRYVVLVTNIRNPETNLPKSYKKNSWTFINNVFFLNLKYTSSITRVQDSIIGSIMNKRMISVNYGMWTNRVYPDLIRKLTLHRCIRRVEVYSVDNFLAKTIDGCGYMEMTH